MRISDVVRTLSESSVQQRHVWTAPVGQGGFDVATRVFSVGGASHVSGLFVQAYRLLAKMPFAMQVPITPKASP